MINVDCQPSGNEWIRKGDYFTDTHTSVKGAGEEETTIEKNIVVRLY